MTFFRSVPCWFVLLACLAAPFIGVAVADDAGPQTSSGSTALAAGGERLEAQARPVHPRLIVSASEVDSFKQRMAQSARLEPGWHYLQNAATGMLDAVPPDEQYARAGSGRYAIVASWYWRHLTNVAFVAFVNDDRRLAAKGVEMLMTACDFERWHDAQFERPGQSDVPRRSGLDTALMASAVAGGYDLLYEHLSEQQRADIRQALVSKGIAPLIAEWVEPASARRQHADDNSAMFCSAAAGLGALCLMDEHAEAQHWVRQARDRVQDWMVNRNGGRSGQDSAFCVNTVLQHVCCFADSLERATGENLFERLTENLLDEAAWSVIAWPEDGQVRQALIPFGTCGTRVDFRLLYAGLTKHLHHPTAAWLAERIVPVPQDVRTLAWLDESVTGMEPDSAVPLAVFPDRGQVVMRGGWGPDTPVAAIKFRQSPGQLDMGTFFLFGGGGPTVTSSGRSFYEAGHAQNYSSQSVAHNVILVDGRSQARGQGELLSAVGTSKLTAASGQLAAAYPADLQSWTRDLVMLPGGIAVLLDRLAANEPRRFDYVLHPFGNFRFPYPLASPGEILIGDQEQPTRIRVHSEVEFTATEQDGFRGKNPAKYIRLNSTESSTSRTFLTVCEWPARRSARSRRLDVSSVRPGRWQVRSVGENWRLILRTGDDAKAGDSTDARMVVVWDQGARSRERHALVLAGKRLGLDNREIMRATRPVYAALEFGQPIWAQFWTPEPVRISMAAEPGADHVFVDGRRADVTRQGSLINFDLPAGESDVQISEIAQFIPRLKAMVSDDLLAVPSSGSVSGFQPGVIARSSSCLLEAQLALDGNINTTWRSLDGLPMPQWLEVSLPAAETVSSIRLAGDQPCSGRIELWNSAAGKYVSAGEFEITAASVAVDCPPTSTDRIRVTVEETAPGASNATISSLQWR